ncbi:MAG: PQQ-dependent sugar dehydrogenase, partial [Verrucomicrobiota bacterium]
DDSVRALPLLTVESELQLPMEAALLARTVAPVDLAGDSQGVLFVLQKDGQVIRIGNEGTFMNVSTRYVDLADENTDSTLGFSAIALHPEFLVEESEGFGKFYVVVSEKARTRLPDFIPEFGFGPETHQDVLYEYQTDYPFASNFKGNRREVIRFSQPGRANNVRSIAFDPLGHLFIAVGDGADEDIERRSPSKNASSLRNVYGKILRIDPMGHDSLNGKYGIPRTNPFHLVSDALPELWAYGLRSPHNLSFDPFERNLLIGESGESGLEEVNASEFGGEHFGWDLMHGKGLFSLVSNSQLAEFITVPAYSFDRYSQSIGGSAGNLVYRGKSFPSLAGSLIVAHKSGDLIVSDSAANGRLQILNPQILSGKKVDALRSTPFGELIVLCEDGSILELRKPESTSEGSGKRKPLYAWQPIVSATSRS